MNPRADHYTFLGGPMDAPTSAVAALIVRAIGAFAVSQFMNNGHQAVSATVAPEPTPTSQTVPTVTPQAQPTGTSAPQPSPTRAAPVGDPLSADTATIQARGYT